MKLYRNWIAGAIVTTALMSSCGFRHKKYENPISKDTQQPDKVLFDKAVKDIEHGRYEVARLTLNTLMNTYDQSEYLAKAKLAIADSWYREGGSHGLAQAEAEYKDFILFYPTMEESAEAQQKVCQIHVKQMEKADRDPTQAVRADEECRTLLTQFPNSKFAPQAAQLLRQIQEVLADAEYRVGSFYYKKGVFYSAANRLQGVSNHYPLYSKADQVLWDAGDSYGRLGPKFRGQSADAFTKLVRDYPLSPLADDAKRRLKQMEKPIPDPDPVAMARQKFELENRETPGMMSHFWGVFRKSPDMSAAAKSGQPAMESLRPTVPVTVPITTPGAGSSDVTVSTTSGSSALDTQPDARQNPPKQGSDAAPAAGASDGQGTAQQPQPTQPDPNTSKKKKK